MTENKYSTKGKAQSEGGAPKTVLRGLNPKILELDSNPKLRQVIETCQEYLQDTLGYSVENTELELRSQEDFVECGGMYLPRSRMAIIPSDSPLVLFHEYFGHGLYCERSQEGKRLVTLEKELLEEEKEEFEGRSFSEGELEEFRVTNSTCRQLQDFRKKNSNLYEAFAIWSEYNLSRVNDVKLPKRRIEAIEQHQDRYGDLPIFYDFGLARVPTADRVKKLLRDVYGKEALDKTELVLHFGSKKPFSDIDLFAVSDEINPSYCDWLDVMSHSSTDTEVKIELLDSRITNAIMTGSLVYGDSSHLEELRRSVLGAPITEAAIEHNLERCEYSKRRSLDKTLGDDLQQRNLKSHKIYFTNATALSRGEKLLTSEKIIDYGNNVLVPSGNFSELGVGIK